MNDGGEAMKATEMLKKQHRQVKSLFKQVEKTEAAGERRRLMDEIGQRLQVHTTIEEEIFYPAVRGLATHKAEAMIDEALEEHHVVDLVLRELPTIDPEDERFEAKMTVLSELVEHHVEEEESEMFKLAKKLDDELEDLAERMEARQSELEARSKGRAA
jgi:Hemerythrin HHE cation binding domain